jgi:hypothetical protein
MFAAHQHCFSCIPNTQFTNFLGNESCKYASIFQFTNIILATTKNQPCPRAERPMNAVEHSFFSVYVGSYVYIATTVTATKFKGFV